MGEPSGERLVGGRYLLAEELGRGGMGAVWRAHDQVLDRPVALKQVLVPGWMGERDRERAFERVLREARATARLRNPYVITIHDVVMDEGHPWIVMELLPASSLEQVLERSGPLPERVVADIGVKLLEALRAAHAAGITHRDVKPANVLLLDDGGVVLTDFGIAHVANSPTLTATGMLMGSPAYMAPERLEGEPAGEASDLWALGATLYAAVEGVPPYPRDSPVAVMAAILMREPRPMRLGARLLPVVEGLLRKSPQERLTAEAASVALAAVAGRRHGGETRRREGSRALAVLVRGDETDPDTPTDPMRAQPHETDPPSPGVPESPALHAPSVSESPAPSSPDAPESPAPPSSGVPESPVLPSSGVPEATSSGVPKGTGSGVPEAAGPSSPGASDTPAPSTSDGAQTPTSPSSGVPEVSGPPSPGVPGASVPLSGSPDPLPAASATPPASFHPLSQAEEAAQAQTPGMAAGGGDAMREEGGLGAVAVRGLGLGAVVAATLGVLAYVGPRVARRLGAEVTVVGPGTALLVLFAAVALLAVVLPRELLPHGGANAILTRALPFVAGAAYLGGYQTGTGSHVTMSLAYALLTVWAAVTSQRTWRRSRAAAAVGAAATACLTALTVAHLWIDLAGPSALTTGLLEALPELTAAAWALHTGWAWWAAARRTG
ncbi:serine/threonine-protein kinase [Nonomuraea africana]|uniref:non-specific serine/threonine protein kinase n=1 Tax=Nonomuraea africana TaxID=46171 RepID=A0ABR9K8P8_9ACTN|nr:serine/threonine-protein kinase [Nonomuraea africana]MBE1558280.1 serine/threonine protein kinase [Nonomuraea africana]